MTPSYPVTCPLCHSTNLEMTVTDDRDFYKCHDCQWTFGGRIRRERLSETDSHESSSFAKPTRRSRRSDAISTR
jgi:transposase-like protein